MRGRLGRPVEFGYKAQVCDNDDGVIVDHTVEQGNPADAPQLAPAVARITRRAGRPPRVVAADRGYGEARVDAELHALGVPTVAIPRKGQPGQARRAVEHRPAFRRLVKWRTGCEGRIAHLKRRSSWDRTLLDGPDGARTWCGHGVLRRLRPQPHQDQRTGRMTNTRHQTTHQPTNEPPTSDPEPTYFFRSK